jgi:hypothetical protein
MPFIPDGLNMSCYGAAAYYRLHIASSLVRPGRGARCVSRRHHRRTGNPDWCDPGSSCRKLPDTRLGDRPVGERGRSWPRQYAEEDNRTIHNSPHDQLKHNHDHRWAADRRHNDSDNSITVHPGHGRRCRTGTVHVRYALRGLGQHLEHPAGG